MERVNDLYHSFTCHPIFNQYVSKLYLPLLPLAEHDCTLAGFIPIQQWKGRQVGLIVAG